MGQLINILKEIQIVRNIDPEKVVALYKEKIGEPGLINIDKSRKVHKIIDTEFGGDQLDYFDTYENLIRKLDQRNLYKLYFKLKNLELNEIQINSTIPIDKVVDLINYLINQPVSVDYTNHLHKIYQEYGIHVVDDIEKMNNNTRNKLYQNLLSIKKLYNINEIQIKQNRVWDFSKYISNINPKRIKSGDILINMDGNEIKYKVKDNFPSAQNILCSTKYEWESEFNKVPSSYFSYDYLIKVNNRRKPK